jgi:hypothetical protein
MANYYGRSGAPMIQPRKDEYRQWLSEARAELKDEQRRRRSAEYKLDIATQKLGELVLEGKISIPTQKLGELALRLAVDDACERERLECEKLLMKG